MQKDINSLKAELTTIESRIKRVQPHDSHIDSLSRSFHLGMVGGSGRNTYRLNKRRENYLDRTIQAAKILTELYQREGELKRQIEFIESGAQQRSEEKKANRNILLAQYWNTLKVGDMVDIGGNSLVMVSKKNAKSIETGKGCKWTAAEIIGKKAAALL